MVFIEYEFGNSTLLQNEKKFMFDLYDRPFER